MHSTIYESDALRQEVLSALKANPTATLATVLGNWSLRWGHPPDVAETQDLTALYAEERQRLAAAPPKPWWKRW
jgi:hypothetical protein